MQQEMMTTMVSRRFFSNRAARESPYPFGHPGLASEPAGLDPAQIWPGPARSGPLLFFLCDYIFADHVLQFKSV
jgi:hypothetical protein